MDAGSDAATEDWGPFGRPLFDDPSARALSRIGVVDVGSNSVRLVIFDGAARSPAYFFNEKVMAGLGAGMAETGKLNPEGKARALSAIKRFQLLAQNMGIAPLTAVATAAVREAEDGPAFREEIRRETGLRLWVIDGEEEARLSAQGVLLGWPGAKGLVSDIGGSSMELAQLADGRVGKRISSKLGPQRLKNIPGGKKGVKAHIRTEIKKLVDVVGNEPKRLFLVGGSWRAIARIDMDRRGYPLAVLHEYRMTRKDVLATVDYIANADLEELRLRTGLGESRMSLVPLASLVLKEMVKQIKPGEIAVSSYGIREGMLYEQMPQRLRDRDPLVEACRFIEQKDARIPGFGRRLYDFVSPLFGARNAPAKRLIKAACLLHDVSWRAHPDYRHEVCFDTVTRANLGGMNHQERIFLGLALLHRYKNNRDGSPFEPLFDLLEPEDIRWAEVLGKALRFGAMLTASEDDTMGKLRYFPKKERLELKLAPGTRALFGEVAEARLTALAQALGPEVQVTVKGR
ncbi:exopolyphosphatase [Alphaproteobacteria bacterium GH1-50]|uniref:Exopolyphosphatase n=1 Tax=Kangsaoukella pontilimi TaxID=2691042 RepID=A0A7C9IH61_9RHOB|nr:Ppx/GppA family phosphatase [Kangsaoukella pontilimi]MXQ08824.1 exopolyphosphatase [Kangsaoukella pontilimi]